MLEASIENEIQGSVLLLVQETLHCALETGLELPSNPCIWGQVGFHSQGN